MATSIATLKGWFVTLAKPTQAQFWAWLDSFRHKDDKIGINDFDQTTANKIQFSITQQQLNEQFALLNPIVGTCNGVELVTLAQRTSIREVEILSNFDGFVKVGLAPDDAEYGESEFYAGSILTINVTRAFKANEGFYITTTNPVDYLIRKA